MIYTIVDEKGDPILDEKDGRPYASSQFFVPLFIKQRCPGGQELKLTNVELVELYFRVQELRRYLNSEKFSKEEWVDRKDVLRRLGF